MIPLAPSLVAVVRLVSEPDPHMRRVWFRDYGAMCSKIGFTLTKGRIGRGGKVSAWGTMGVATALAGYRTALSSTGWTISLPSQHKSASKPLLFSCRGTIFQNCSQFSESVVGMFACLRVLNIESFLMSGCGQSHEPPRECLKALPQASSATFKQKCKYRPKKVLIAIIRLI